MYEDLDLIVSTKKKRDREKEREGEGAQVIFLAVYKIRNNDVIVASLLIKSYRTAMKPEQQQKGILSPYFHPPMKM